MRFDVSVVRHWLWGFHVSVNVGQYPRPRFNSRCVVSRDYYTMQVEDKPLARFWVIRPIIFPQVSPSFVVFTVSSTAGALGIAVRFAD